MASRAEIFSTFKVAEMSEPEGYSDSQILDVKFDPLTVIADHSPAIIDFQFPRGCFLGLTFPCDDAMLCSIISSLNNSRMFSPTSLHIDGGARALFDILEAKLADRYRIAVPQRMSLDSFGIHVGTVGTV